MVGGLDKGVIEAYSIESQKMVKQYLNGHSNRILSISCKN